MGSARRLWTHMCAHVLCVCTCECVAVCTCARVYTRAHMYVNICVVWAHLCVNTCVVWAHVYVNTCVVWSHVHMWALQSRFFNVFGGGEAPWAPCVLTASHLPAQPQALSAPAVPVAAERAWLVSDQHGGSVGTLVSAVERDIGGCPPEPKTPCSGWRLK